MRRRGGGMQRQQQHAAAGSSRQQQQRQPRTCAILSRIVRIARGRRLMGTSSMSDVERSSAAPRRRPVKGLYPARMCPRSTSGTPASGRHRDRKVR
jgi:hypothetical protein